MKRIVLTGGGTAGHVTPNLALIPVLQQEGWDIHYIATKDGMEKELVTAVPGITYHEIHSGKLRRYIDLKNLSDPFHVVQGIFEATKIIRELKPNIVFSKGGFVSVPVVYGAYLNHIPVLGHESDMTPGLANKLSTPCVKKLLCTFPEAAKAAGAKGCYTGTPLRQDLFSGSREKGLSLFGFDGTKAILMVTGGSSGAAAINRAVRLALPDLTRSFHVLHLCGKGNIDPMLNDMEGYRQVDYLGDEMKHAYAMADILISRAGSNTLSEILALHKPALLIPYPMEASRGDQIMNADSFAKRNLARVLMQQDMTPDSLTKRVIETYHDRGILIDAMEKEPSADGLGNVMKYIHEYALPEQ